MEKVTLRDMALAYIQTLKNRAVELQNEFNAIANQIKVCEDSLKDEETKAEEKDE